MPFGYRVPLNDNNGSASGPTKKVRVRMATREEQLAQEQQGAAAIAGGNAPSSSAPTGRSAERVLELNATQFDQDVRSRVKEAFHLQLPFAALEIKRLDGSRLGDGESLLTDRDVSRIVTHDELLLVFVKPFAIPGGKSPGRYRLDGNKLGEGSFSQVYRGTDTETGERVAIKVVDASMLDSSAARRYHEREKSIVQEVDHPNIVTTLAVIETTPQQLAPVFGAAFARSPSAGTVFHWFVMEFCEGGALSEYCSRGRRFTEVQARKCISQLADAFQYLHRRNIVHRDLKPQNILLTSRNLMTADYKLCDFGFARTHRLAPEAGEMSPDLMQSYPNTPLYAAPELMLHVPYDNRCDLWSLGAILYELLAGSVLTTAKDIPSLISEHRTGKEVKALPQDVKVSDPCQDLLRNLLVRDRERRISFKDFFAHPFVYGISTRRVHLIVGGSNKTASFDVAVRNEHQVEELKGALMRQTKVPKSAQLLIADQQPDGAASTEPGGFELPADATCAVWNARSPLFVFDARAVESLSVGTVPNASAFKIAEANPTVSLTPEVTQLIADLQAVATPKGAQTASDRLRVVRERFQQLRDVFGAFELAASTNMNTEETTVLQHAKVQVRAFGVVLSCLRRLANELFPESESIDTVTFVANTLKRCESDATHILRELPAVLADLAKRPLSGPLLQANPSAKTLADLADMPHLRSSLDRLQELTGRVSKWRDSACGLLAEVPLPSQTLHQVITKHTLRLEEERRMSYPLLQAFVEDCDQALSRCNTELRALSAQGPQMSSADVEVTCSALEERCALTVARIADAQSLATDIANELSEAWEHTQVVAAYTQRHVALLQALRRVHAELRLHCTMAEDVGSLCGSLGHFLWGDSQEKPVGHCEFLVRAQAYSAEMARRAEALRRVEDFAAVASTAVNGWVVIEKTRWDAFAQKNRTIDETAIPVLNSTFFPGVLDGADRVPPVPVLLPGRPGRERNDNDVLQQLEVKAVQFLLSDATPTTSSGGGSADVRALTAALHAVAQPSSAAAQAPRSPSHQGTSADSSQVAVLQRELEIARQRIADRDKLIAEFDTQLSSGDRAAGAEVAQLRRDLAAARQQIAGRDALIGEFERERSELIEASRTAAKPPQAGGRGDGASIDEDSHQRLELLSETLRADHGLAVCPICTKVTSVEQIEAHFLSTHG